MTSVSVSELKGHTLGAEFIPQFQEVFHDAIVNHNDFPGAAQMRVGVAGRRRAMRSPTRMTDAHIAVQWRLSHQFIETG
jgi:hypothetical protein